MQDRREILSPRVTRLRMTRPLVTTERIKVGPQFRVTKWIRQIACRFVPGRLQGSPELVNLGYQLFDFRGLCFALLFALLYALRVHLNGLLP